MERLELTSGTLDLLFNFTSCGRLKLLLGTRSRELRMTAPSQTVDASATEGWGTILVDTVDAHLGPIAAARAELETS